MTCTAMDSPVGSGVNFVAINLPGLTVFGPWLPEGNPCHKLSPSMPFIDHYAEAYGGLSSVVLWY